MAEGSRGGWREAGDRVVASDPGLNRLRMAVSAAVAMSSALGLEYGFARVTHAGAQGTLVAMLLGTIMAMMGSMALSGSAFWPKARTAVFFPVAIGAGMLVGVAVAGRTDLMLCAFVAVMFAAVYVRRFGMAFFFYGFMFWMGYFFAAFLGATLSAVPGMLYAVCVATAWILLLSATVLRTNPRRTLGRVRGAFGARSRAVAAACADLLEDAAAGAADPRRTARLRRRLHARQLRLAEAALMIEGWSADPGALPAGWSGPALRRRLLDAHLAVDALAEAALLLEPLAADGGLAATAAGIARLVARRQYRAAERAARPLLRVSGTPQDDGYWPAQHLAAAVVEFVTLADEPPQEPHRPPPADGADPGDGVRLADDAVQFEPAVVLTQGMLPGSAAVAGDVAARGHRWNPLSRASLTTRQAIQVAVAGSLAIVAGRELSEARYYWAVLAAFIAFAGTATRSETTIKAVNRVLGTLVGLGAGIGFAHLTAGHTMWVLVVIVASMSCGFYLVNVSYGSMIFFVTIMVSQLYSVLHEFSAGLLVLRLEETSLGAAIGIAVALVVLPTSTRDTVGTARQRFFTALGEVLTASAARLRPDDPGQPAPPAGSSAVSDAELDALTRVLDHRLQQLALVARPLTRPMVWRNDPRAVRHRLTLFAAVTRHSRALAMAPRRLPESARSGPLATACLALAEATESLAGHPVAPARPAPEVESRLAAAESALLAHRPRCLGAQLPPYTRPLVHLRQLLHELAAAPGASGAERPAPPVPPAGRPVRDDAGVRRLADDELAIGGLVVGGAGTPLGQAALAVTDPDGRQLGRAVSHVDGRFAIGVPRRGSYLLIGSADGHAPRAVTVAVDGRPFEVRVALGRLGGLSGAVRDAVTGEPLPAAELTVTDAGGREVARGAAAPDGGFRFPVLPAGGYTLAVSAPGHRPATVPVEVADGGTPSCDVRLAPGPRIGGTVRGRSGTPLVEARVTLIDTQGNLVGSAVTDRDGHYRFPGLCPGDYTMIARGYFPASGSLTVPNGGRAALDVYLGEVRYNE